MKNCYVVMKDLETAKKVVEHFQNDGTKESIGGAAVRITLAGTKEIDYKHSIFVGGIPYGFK